jgi:hypothetical protein
MAGGVQFDEDQGISQNMPRARGVTLMDMLVRWGIVKNVAQAQLLLLIVSGIFLVVMYFLLQYAVQSTPSLGADTLRPGESVPSYVQQQNN